MYSNNVKYVGCDDADLTLFESQYDLPEGMCYNSYVIMGDKVAVMDSVDVRKTAEWLDRVAKALDGRTPDYIVVHHMEPDHSGSLAAFLAAYPSATVVTSAKAVQMAAQFDCPLDPAHTLTVKDGQPLSLGSLTLQFIGAPMVHWPEVIMSYCPEERTLFSADGFGKFGVYAADADDWACEARRYYFNICGKYGQQVAAVLRKASALDVATIAPLHGPVLDGERLAEALRLYSIWSKYDVETEGVLVAHASIHGHTAAAAEAFADMLRARGAGKVAVTDLCRDDMAEAIEDAFRMGRLVVFGASYDADVFPPMHFFLWKLGMKGYRNRTVGIVENGSWAPTAGKAMRALLEPLSGVRIVEPLVTIRSAMKEADRPQLEALADAILA